MCLFCELKLQRNSSMISKGKDVILVKRDGSSYHLITNQMLINSTYKNGAEMLGCQLECH